MTPDEQSLELAIRVERELVQGAQAWVVVSACCWVLAGLVVQAVWRGESRERALALVIEQLARYVEELQHHTQPETLQ